jgi:hypothetical protein
LKQQPANDLSRAEQGTPDNAVGTEGIPSISPVDQLVAAE